MATARIAGTLGEIDGGISIGGQNAMRCNVTKRV
jgi:hypothetical protein